MDNTIRDAPEDIQARRLITLGLFDRVFYQAQCRVEFDSDLAAARHAIRWGAKRGWAFHPLVEPDYLPIGWTTAWKERGNFRRLLERLINTAEPRDLSPLFSPRRWLELHPDAGTHPAGALGHFLETARPDTVLPTPEDFLGAPPSWGRVREEALRRADEYGHQLARVRKRTIDVWNARDHADWLRRWAAAPVPRFADRPAVSVVMPVKDRPQIVVDAIASIQAQTHRDWELLVVDDGSTDHTPQVLHELAGQDPRIRVFELPVSGGAAAARNVGIRQARGIYTTFLDSDNVWEPVFLQLSLAAMHGQGLRVAHAVAEVTVGGPATYLAFQGDYDDLIIKNHVPLIVLVAETQLLREVGGLDESFRRWMDHDLVLRLSRRTPITLLPFIGARYDSVEGSADRITRTESDNWEFAALGKNLVDWQAEEERLGERVRGRTSILMPTFRDFTMTRRAVLAVLAQADAAQANVEVVVIDNGSQRSVSALLWATFAGDARVVVRRLARNYNFAGGCNAAFAYSTGARVVFLNNDTVVRADWLEPLVAPLADPDVLGTQPLLLFPDDTVQSAGTVFLADERVASPFLPGHPAEDARRDSGGGFEAVTAAALAMRAEDVIALHGFDCLYANGMEDVDLCLRARERNPRGFFSVIHDSVVTHYESRTPGRGTYIAENRRIFLDRWRGRLPAGTDGRDRYLAVGFEVAAVQGDGSPYPAPRAVLSRPGSALERATAQRVPQRLRWSINISSVPGPGGDRWGDSHFAAALTGALGALQQEPVVFRHGAHDSSVAHLSDVVLTLRGLTPAHPQPGAVNVLWVISHPDLVDVREVQQFDIVASASPAWAEAMSRTSGRPVHVVYQATDPSLFAPRFVRDDGHSVLFVGGTRGQESRQIVSDALEAQVELAVYGPGWAGRLPDGVLQAAYLENVDLSNAYGSAGVVLNDHWPDMAANGFLNNRLFDAVASGARVISDRVDGIEELFRGSVRTYATVEELAYLCSGAGRLSFAPAAERIEVAERIRAEHSFAARAEQLLMLVQDALRERARG
ncbi:glycosyltransferase [Jatrophihabitans cynanchi]|uniref:Glycosyltransferase n=1 Tax=Jatrophihabitans cynanchi TaxID=2944128 RepID=A0ABY7JUI1_9ACTN|nr:glycosyltransferase [Jatrophihabitans sp. SB3-54]WAX56029.1 glycosyltransferase [Jatrophihabitans sp. SB3-54]